MVYLNNTREIQELYIPKTLRNAEGRVFFQAFSTGTLQGFSFYAREYDSTNLYHKVIIELPKIKDGEYEYVLSDEKGILSTGILYIGGNDTPVEYNKEIKYEQYSE